MTRYRDKETGDVVEVVRHGMLATVCIDVQGDCHSIDCDEFDARFEPVEPDNVR